MMMKIMTKAMMVRVTLVIRASRGTVPATSKIRDFGVIYFIYRKTDETYRRQQDIRLLGTESCIGMSDLA